jgi:hypothetical protein
MLTCAIKLAAMHSVLLIGVGTAPTQTHGDGVVFCRSGFDPVSAHADHIDMQPLLLQKTGTSCLQDLPGIARYKSLHNSSKHSGTTAKRQPHKISDQGIREQNIPAVPHLHVNCCKPLVVSHI